MKDFILAWQTYQQNKKGRDNRLVRWTQAFLVFFLTTLTLTSASVQTYLQGNLKALLGSDMVIAQYQKLADNQKAELSGLVDVVSETSVMPIALTSKEEWQRVQLKTVDDAYPVQGELTKSTELGGIAEPVANGPKFGEIWVDSRVIARLGLSVGETVSIANTELTVGAILQHEPDRLMEGHTVEMRAMVHHASLPEDTLNLGERRYRYLLAASDAARPAVTAWAQKNVPDAQLLDRHTGRHPLSAYWVRVENFLGLASVLLFFMAAIAINMAGRRQLEQQKHRLALYGSMGVPLKRSLGLAFQEWGFAFFAALLPAILFAYGAQHFLVIELQNQFSGLTAGLHIAPVLKTTLLVFLLLLSAQVPTFVQLARTSVVSLVRQQPQSGFALWQLVWSFLTLAALAAAYSDNWLLTAMTLSAMGAALLLMMFMTWFSLSVGEVWGRKRPGILPFAFFIMKKRLFSKSTQILGLGLCATLLLFTLMLMKDIGGAMQSQLRAENGNLMISDAQDNQMNAIEAWAKETGSVVRHTSPFTHALAVRVNGKTIADFVSQPSETSARLERPIRLSWSETVPANNRVTSGSWWEPNTASWQQVSVEDEVLMDMGLELGDVLTFDVEGRLYDFTIAATHVFKSGGSNITYWFQVPAGAVPHIEAPTHHMGSMELPEAAWPQLSKLLAENPTLSVVSLQELTARFDSTLAIVTKATVGFSGMILMLSL
ncbi:MAG: ABC transporter permease, partial [Kordiimonas sp.]